MQVWEAGQPASLLFTPQDVVGSMTSSSNQTWASSSHYLGAVVEDAVIVSDLWKSLESLDNVTTYRPARLDRMELPTRSSDGYAQVTIAQRDETVTVPTRLVVGADGGRSPTRQLAGGSMQLHGWSYPQSAMTFTARLSSNHHGRAFQRFLPNGGVVALLPTFDPNYGIVVWSTTPELVQHYRHDPDAAIDALNEALQAGPEQLNSLFGGRGDDYDHDTAPSWWSNLQYGVDKVLETMQYGPAIWAQDMAGPFVAPPLLASIVSPCFTFPLSCQQVDHYVRPRCALVGDAAHAVHPMAGQGLNLGLHDVADLVSCIERAHRAGMDLSSLVESDYPMSRKAQVSTTLSGIHALYRVFGWQHTWAKHAKSVGMNLVQNVGPLRRAVVHTATQGVAY